jgi:hypothetical protein
LSTTLCCRSPQFFDNFKINYNGSDKKWSLAELIVKCSQEEERLRVEHKDFVNLISQYFNRNHGHGKSDGKSSRQKKGMGKKSYEPPKKEGAKEEFSDKGPKCHHCNDWEHIRRDCPVFKAWLAKKDNNDIISFIDESFFTYFSRDTWLIDSGAPCT